MHSAKRIEIVSDSVELGRILRSLDKAGVPNYTIIRNVAGKGVTGRFDDSAVTDLDNIYVIAFCLPDQVKPVMENLRPILNKFGGSCWISDVMEVRSVRCVASM